MPWRCRLLCVRSISRAGLIGAILEDGKRAIFYADISVAERLAFTGRSSLKGEFQGGRVMCGDPDPPQPCNAICNVISGEDTCRAQVKPN